MPPDSPPVDAAALLESASTPMLRVDDEGQVTWVNGRAREWLLAAGARLPQAWSALTGLGRPAPAPDAFDAEVVPPAGPALACRIACSSWPGGGMLVVLTPVDDLQVRAARCRGLEERLDEVLELGQLGIWERDIPSGAGRWDRHVFALFGLDPAEPTPTLTEVLDHLVPEDRAGYDEALRASLRQPGLYSHRHRVRHPDGSVRRVHSHWRVHADAQGRPVLAFGVLRDDSEAWALARSHDEATSQLAAAVELGRIAIFRQDLREQVVHFNRHAFDILGIPPREGGVPIDEVRATTHPDDLAALIASTAQAVATRMPVDLETRHRRGDGWCAVLTRRVVQCDLDGQPVAIAGVGLDLTEQRLKERATQDLLRRFQVVTRAAGVGYWTLEPGAERAQWSAELRAIHGLPADEAVPPFRRWIGDYVHPDDRERVRQSFAAWSREGFPPHEAQFRALRFDGTVIDLITHSRIEGDPGRPMLFGVVIDVTERRAAEAALRAAGERAALIASALGIGTWEMDLDAGTAYWNEQMWRLRGLEPGDEPPDRAQRIAMVHPDDRAMVTSMLERAQTDASPVEYDFRVRWPDGSWRWLASRSVPLRDAAGGIMRRRIGINWDITAARETSLAHEQKIAAQRELQAKARFLSRMSHELRTPLNAVLGFTELLLAPAGGAAAGGTDSDRRRLEHIRAAGQHLLALIDDVLELSRLEGEEVPIAIEPVPLGEAVTAVLALVEPMARAREIEIAVPGPLAFTPLADPTRLRQVLLNLLTNAIKYNVAGGRVVVEAGEHDGIVTVAVSDTGRGMTADQLRHLFEPFNRLGAETTGVEGTGIGLAIVKALVERMGGTVSVSSTAGVGSRFELRLRDGALVPPLQPGKLATPQEMALAATAGRGAGGGRVLYVEDNPVNAMIVGELLGRRSDLQLHIAVDGASGLAQARALNPDLILLDMQLPDIDGMQVFAALKADPATASIPCVALSANAMPADIEKALQAGMADYWTKPLDFRAFMVSIEAIFGPPPP